MKTKLYIDARSNEVNEEYKKDVVKKLSNRLLFRILIVTFEQPILHADVRKKEI